MSAIGIMPATTHVLGVVSDTHGLLRPEVLTALQGSEQIIHAGDIGGPEILAELGSVAPTLAVRGNNDTDEWARMLEETKRLRIGELEILVLHDLHKLSADLAGVGVVISGHSHAPKIERREGILYLNPGAAGPRRFKLPVAVARLFVCGRRAEAELIRLSE